MDGDPGQAPLLRERWPVLAGELDAALAAVGEKSLRRRASRLRVVQMCSCEDDFCQSFRTAPATGKAYGPGHRNVWLDPPWPGYLVLDVVRGIIVHIEVLYRPPLD
ncbi:hypothetical protein ACFO1B_33675 [Dactylosporangium siamense]|uniref:Uncharacterized protein n=1 Tax=Dactylosporangium siamense TaxID=685454 RepID=A0A919U4S2_9ACTN|nr:hypothetical protein [Dactylosporangium siamense]GIG42444.1 hypothetical protein Dsi01nite_004850 [Dactylosporangium siamense]